ncbi:hypothetical protein ASZ90_005270 [hydrocarbon metagenome]|uniref:Uncharacterized protein n=1 Tax=hydrocarbon metagenome TaxID=938273 RepID=A0A0W8FVK8_9ZZZZ
MVVSEDLDKDWFKKYDDLHYSLENKTINFNKNLIQKLKNNYNWKDDYIIREIVE